MFEDADGVSAATATAASAATPDCLELPGGSDVLFLIGEDLAEASRASLGTEFAVGVAPGAVQHAALERLSSLARQGGGSLTDGEVLEVMAAWARQAAAAESQVRAWAQVLARRPAMSPTWRSASGARCEAAADEVGFRLGVSRQRGQQLIDEGRALDGQLWPVDEELAAGRIDAGKATILVAALAEQEPHVATAVCEQVLPVAPELDHAGLRRRVQQVIVQVDPGEADSRHERAVRRRRVNRVRVLADGMASFSALLAAPDAVALEQACEAAARAARADGDGRTLEQLRADALASMAAQVLTDQTLPLLRLGDAPAAPPGSRRRTGRTAKASDGSASRSGGAAVPLEPVAFSGRTACLTVIATDAVRCGSPSPVALAEVAAHDLYDWEPDPWDPSSDLPPTHDAPAASAAAAAKSSGPPGQDLDPGNDPYVDWSPAATFRPGLDAPELVGYGALSPQVVRALIGSAPWVDVVAPVCPQADPPPPVDSYRPSAQLDRHVRLRDITCVVPGCLVPASRCDVDHQVPWPEGPTSAANLHTLCRRHHLLKTHAGHDLTVLADGTVQWRTAVGQVLTRTPDGRLTRSGDPAPRGPAWGRRHALPRLTDARINQILRDLDEDDEADHPALLAQPAGGPQHNAVRT